MVIYKYMVQYLAIGLVLLLHHVSKNHKKCVNIEENLGSGIQFGDNHIQLINELTSWYSNWRLNGVKNCTSYPKPLQPDSSEFPYSWKSFQEHFLNTYF